MKPLYIAFLTVAVFAIIVFVLGLGVHIMDTRRRLNSLTDAIIVNQRSIETMQDGIPYSQA